MLQKIFQLKPTNWLQGLSPSEYYDGGKALYEANGIDLFKYPGRLAVGYGTKQIGTTTVTSAITSFENNPNANYMYGIGQTNIYKIGLINDSVTVATTTSQVGSDLEIYNGNLLYSQQTRLGSYNWTTFTDSAIGGNGFLTTSYWHPMKLGADENLYIGNVNKIAKWDGTIATAARLTFDAGYTIKTIASDGFYLVIGATVGTGTFKKVYVMFWDMVADQISRKYELPGATTIHYLQEKDGRIIAFCDNRIYQCSFDSYPTELIKNGKGRYVFGKATGKISTIYNGLIVFQVSGYGHLGAYGSSEEGIGEIFQIPWSVGERDVTAMNNAYGAIYCANNDNRLFKISASNAGLSGVSIKTPIIDLERDWKLHFIKIQTEKLSSGDDITIQLLNQSGGSVLATGTFTYAVDGTKTKKNIPIGGVISSQAQFIVTINGGNPKIKSVGLYGEPLAEL
jgi:hypothetical protein